MIQPGINIIWIVIGRQCPGNISSYFYRKGFIKKFFDAFKGLRWNEQKYILINIRKNRNINKQMKTLLIWAPIALKGLAVLSFSSTGSNKDRLRLLVLKASVWPKLSPDTLTLTLWEQVQASWTSVEAGSWPEESGVVGSEVIFWPLCPLWSSKSLAPDRQMHLHWSRGPPLEMHMNNRIIWADWAPQSSTR